MNEDGERSGERDLRVSVEGSGLGGSTDPADSSIHPSAGALRRFVDGGLAASEMRQVFRHLLHGCRECQATASAVWNVGPTGALLGDGPEVPAASSHLEAKPAAAAGVVAAGSETSETSEASKDDAAYEAVLDRVFRRATQEESALEEARQRALGLLAELLQHSPARQLLLVYNSARFRDRSLCEQLLAASHEEGFRDPVRSQQLARAGVVVAERLQAALDPAAPDLPKIDLIAGLRARAWAQLGNALRIGSDLEAAGSAYQSAEAVLAGNRRIAALDRARVLDLKASFARDMRQLAEAGRLLDRVIAIYRRLGQSNLLGQALNQKALVLDEWGDTQGSIALLQRALELLDQREESRWFLIVRHNLIRALVADDRPREAFALLFHTRPLYLKMGDRMTLLRLRWLEGLVARGLRRLDQAEAAFREVREAFVELGRAYDAALASLDLATVLAEKGKHQEMRRLAQEMLVFFESRQIHREAMAAFLVFCDAARREQASLDLVREVAAFLKQARSTPDLNFKGRPLA